MAAWLAPAVAAGASLLGSAINKSSQSSANRQNFELAKYQNAWNLQQWNRENEYNHPAMQMARLKQAGLNPNLVYGSGTQTTSASSPKAAHMEVAPYLQSSQDLGAAAQAAINAQQLQRQNELAKSQSDYLRQQAITEGQKQASMAIQNAKGSIDLSIARELQETSIEAGRANLMKLQGEAHQSMNNANITDFIHRELQPLQKQMSQAQLDQVRLSMQNLAQDMNFNKFEQDMKRAGIYPQDKIYVRLLSRLIKLLFPKLNLNF